MRTCDAVGLQHLFVLQTEEDLKFKKIKVGQTTSGGNAKWLAVHLYHDRIACFQHVRSLVNNIYATHLASDSMSLYDLDFTGSIALLFGNERDGISPETLALTDGNFLIPMHGMTQSLNISVACAVTLFEGLRQREKEGLYENNTSMKEEQKEALFREYLDRHEKGNVKWIREKTGL